ncbi:DUF3558 family protein [Nocardia sp. X0981]
MRNLPILNAAVLTIVFSAACSGAQEQITPVTPTSPIPPKIAVQVPPIQHQTPEESAFSAPDPCLELGDDIVEQFGFDPLTRERSEDLPRDFIFVGCNFEDRRLPIQPSPSTVAERYLSISSTDIKISEVWERTENTTDLKVGDRDAVSYTTASDKVCSIAIDKPYGALIISKSVVRNQTREGACDNMTEIVAAIAGALPD